MQELEQTPFASTKAYRSAFDEGLWSLLEQGTLGSFILVCANFSLDAGLMENNRGRLRQRFDKLSSHIIDTLRNGHALQENDEDQLVFMKMMALGFDALQPMRLRREGPWEFQFNPLRSFRPRRITDHAVAGIRQAFDPDMFNFNRPFMLKERLWEGRLFDRDVSLYYNKYPFISGHALLVPEREHGLAQYVEAGMHHYLWELTAALSHNMPGVGFGYNAYGAYASVNHLHFQMFVRDTPWSVQSPHWRHNGGDTAYPLDCLAFDDAAAAWRKLNELHIRQQTYNLLYLPGRLLLFPRRAQGTYAQPAWTLGFTWYEVSGGLVTYNRQDFEAIHESGMATALAQLNPTS